MDLLARLLMIGFIIIVAVILYYWKKFPEALNPSDNPINDRAFVVILVTGQLLYITLAIFVLAPIASGWGDAYFYLSNLVGTILFIILPSWYLLDKRQGSLHEFGLRGGQNLFFAIMAVIAYLVYGSLRIVLLEPNVFTILALILFFYSNAFMEEYIYRSLIQTRLERSYGQNKALVYQTLLFLFIHIPANIGQYVVLGDLSLLLAQFAFQLIHGFIYGLVFMKTRSIWPSVIIHYLTNWMGPWYFTLQQMSG